MGKQEKKQVKILHGLKISIKISMLTSPMATAAELTIMLNNNPSSHLNRYYNELINWSRQPKWKETLGKYNCYNLNIIRLFNQSDSGHTFPSVFHQYSMKHNLKIMQSQFLWELTIPNRLQYSCIKCLDEQWFFIFYWKDNNERKSQPKTSFKDIDLHHL